MSKVGKKFKTKAEIESFNGQNTEVFYQGGSLIFDCFNKEKDLVEYIVNNIDSFVGHYFNDKVISFEIDKPLKKQFGLSARGKRVDLFIQGEEGIYIIEFKNAKNPTEIRSAIGQILDYGREYLDPKKELVIVSNMYDVDVAKTIKYYNLPIRYIVFSKNIAMEVKEIVN